MKAHCLFEQSGTFKNEFKKLGIEAYDYDILNDFGETDFQVDLFAEIDNAYTGGASIFDNFTSEDIILAFFPCIRFEAEILLSFRGQTHGMEKWTYKRKMENCMRLMDELNHNYDLVNKLFIVCMDRVLPLIVENPFSEEHFLRRYWCYPPSIIDRDRRAKGDFMKKPTQYWFVNIEPKNNLIFEPLEPVPELKDAVRFMNKDYANKMGARSIKTARSMIHPQYANRFIRQYILPEQKGDSDV